MSNYRKTGKIFFLLPALLALAALSGCGTRYLIQRPGTVGVLMQDVEATVSFPDKDGNLVPATGTMPKGTLVNGPKIDSKPEAGK